MFTHRQAFYTETGLSQGIYVTVDASGYAIPAGTNGHSIGSVEQASGNTDGQYDPSVTSTLSVTVLLFQPARRAAVTGLTGAAISPGTLWYYAAAGMINITGTQVAGISFETAYNNNDVIGINSVSN